MFQIVRIAPRHCPITDAMTGSTAHRLPMAYHSSDLAHKLAGRMHQADYEACGDDTFIVVPYGACPFTRAHHRPMQMLDWNATGPIPF